MLNLFENELNMSPNQIELKLTKSEMNSRQLNRRLAQAMMLLLK